MGNRSSINAHWTSDNNSNRDIPKASGTPPETFVRHALGALQVKVEVAAAVEHLLAVHDPHRGVGVDDLEVVVDRLAVVDHGRGYLAAKLLHPQAGFALAHLDVGEPIPVVIEANQRFDVGSRNECLTEPLRLGQPTIHAVPGDELATCPLA